MASEKKLTPYGVMLASLNEGRLADLCLADGVQTGPFGTQLHQEDYVEDGTPIITVEHLGENRIVHQDLPRVSEEDRQRLTKYSLQTGDIVFSRVGSVDRRAIVRETENGWLFSGRCLRVRPDPGKLDAQWLSYFFGLPSFKQYIRGIAVGATMPSINTKILSDVPIYFPDIDQQRKAAKFFASLDDKIEINRRINQTLEAMAQAIFKSWFVDFDPVKAKIAAKAAHTPALSQREEMVLRAAMRAISGKTDAELDALPPEHYQQLAATAALFPDEMVDSELGEIPKGWEVQPLSKMIQLIGGGTPKRSESSYWRGDVLWYSVKDTPADGDVWVVDTDEKISSLGLQKSSAKLLPVGTTIISARGTVGKLAMVGYEMAMNQSCYGVAGADDLGNCFNYFNLKEAVETLKRNTHGAVFDTITQSTFETVVCVRPLSDQHRAFDQQVQPLLDQIRANVIQNRVLATLRDTLLPKLLAGELSVAALSEEVEV